MSEDGKKHVMQEVLESIVENRSGDMGDLRAYSGRGMYNRECLAVFNWDLAPLLADILRETVENFKGDAEEIAEALESLHTDQMGRDGIVIYFKNIGFLDPEEIEVSERETLVPPAEELN